MSGNNLAQVWKPNFINTHNSSSHGEAAVEESVPNNGPNRSEQAFSELNYLVHYAEESRKMSALRIQYSESMLNMKHEFERGRSDVKFQEIYCYLNNIGQLIEESEARGKTDLIQIIKSQRNLISNIHDIEAHNRQERESMQETLFINSQTMDLQEKELFNLKYVVEDMRMEMKKIYETINISKNSVMGEITTVNSLLKQEINAVRINCKTPKTLTPEIKKENLIPQVKSNVKNLLPEEPKILNNKINSSIRRTEDKTKDEKQNKHPDPEDDSDEGNDKELDKIYTLSFDETGFAFKRIKRTESNDPHFEFDWTFTHEIIRDSIRYEILDTAENNKSLTKKIDKKTKIWKKDFDPKRVKKLNQAVYIYELRYSDDGVEMIKHPNVLSRRNKLETFFLLKSYRYEFVDYIRLEENRKQEEKRKIEAETLKKQEKEARKTGRWNNSRNFTPSHQTQRNYNQNWSRPYGYQSSYNNYNKPWNNRTHRFNNNSQGVRGSTTNLLLEVVERLAKQVSTATKN